MLAQIICQILRKKPETNFSADNSVANLVAMMISKRWLALTCSEMVEGQVPEVESNDKCLHTFLPRYYAPFRPKINTTSHHITTVSSCVAKLATTQNHF